MATWVRYPLPFLWAFPPWRACEVEVRYPPWKGVSQRYLRDTLWKQGKWVQYSPLRYYLERVLRDMGGYLALGRWVQKNPCAHKNKIGILSPPPNQNSRPPPPKRGILWTWRFSCRKKAFFPRVHKIGTAISGPRIADTNFTDTRVFLS